MKMSWIPEKYKPEKPDFKYLRDRAEGGFGAYPNYVLWMLDMLEEANILLSEYNGAWETEDTIRWLQKFKGNENE